MRKNRVEGKGRQKGKKEECMNGGEVRMIVKKGMRKETVKSGQETEHRKGRRLEE